MEENEIKTETNIKESEISREFFRLRFQRAENEKLIANIENQIVQNSSFLSSICSRHPEYYNTKLSLNVYQKQLTKLKDTNKSLTKQLRKLEKDTEGPNNNDAGGKKIKVNETLIDQQQDIIFEIIEQIENGLIPDVKLLNGYLNNSSPDFPKAFGKVRQIQEAITYLKSDLQIAANLFQDKIYIDEDF